MKAVAILSPIELQTTTGKKLFKSRTETIRVSQLDYYLMLAGDSDFIPQGLRGRSAAQFQLDAKREIETAFGTKGEGYVSDAVHAALVRTVQSSNVDIRTNDGDFGAAVLWCFVPFMDAVANARPVTAQPAIQEAPSAAEGSGAQSAQASSEPLIARGAEGAAESATHA